MIVKSGEQPFTSEVEVEFLSDAHIEHMVGLVGQIFVHNLQRLVLGNAGMDDVAGYIVNALRRELLREDDKTVITSAT